MPDRAQRPRTEILQVALGEAGVGPQRDDEPQAGTVDLTQRLGLAQRRVAHHQHPGLANRARRSND